MSDFNAVANHSLKQKSRVQGIGTYFLPIPMSKYKLEAATSISEQDAHAAADVPAGKIEEGNTTGPVKNHWAVKLLAQIEERLVL